MKYTLLFILIFSGAIKLLSQDTTYFYLDRAGFETKKERAFYYRKVFKLNDGYIGYDYYANDTLRMTGAYTSAKADVKMGKFTYYYENGVKSREGIFVADKYNGIWEYYYKSGKLASKVDYLMDSEVSLEYWDEDGNKMTGPNASEVMPEFPGGEGALMKYIKSNLHYPDSALKYDIAGMVKIGFIINTEGYLEDVKVVRSVHPFIDEEALRIIRNMPRWSPGRQYNVPVNVSYTLPIKFSL